MTTAFHLNNQEAKRELAVYDNIILLPFGPVPTYLGVKLDRSFTFRTLIEALGKKLKSRVALLRRLVWSGRGANAKTMSVAAHSRVYSTSEYCSPVWCPCAHICLIDIVFDDAMRIISGCLCPTPTYYLLNLTSNQPAELRRQRANLPFLSLAYRNGRAHEERLRSRPFFVLKARKLLNELSTLSIGAEQWTDYKWDVKYSEGQSELRFFVPRPSAKPLALGVPRSACSVRLKRLCTRVRKFQSSILKSGLAPTSIYEVAALCQAAADVILESYYIFPQRISWITGTGLRD